MPPSRPFLEEVGAPPGRLRIAFTTKPASGRPIDPECVTAVERTAKLLAGARPRRRRSAAAARLGRVSARRPSGLGRVHRARRRHHRAAHRPQAVARHARGGDAVVLRGRQEAPRHRAAGRARVLQRPVARVRRVLRAVPDAAHADPRAAAGPARRDRPEQGRHHRLGVDPARLRAGAVHAARSTPPANRRSRCRCTGAPTACRSACRSPGASATRPACSGSRRSSRRRGPGGIAARRSTSPPQPQASTDL